MNRDNVYADLHMHTQESDGDNTFKEMLEEAKSKGLSAIAITDHDVPNSNLNQPIQEIKGVEVIRGIELRVETPGFGRIDLLGYGVTLGGDLQKEVEKIKKGRKKRAKKVVSSIESKLNISLDIDTDNSRIGRPHIARAIEKNDDLDYNYQEAFDNLIGRDCEHYESRYVTPVREGIKMLKNNCELISIAHPFLYEDTRKTLQLQNIVDGVEYYYPYNKDVDLTLVDKNKVLTGGSDAHFKQKIGVTGLDKEEYEEFKKNFYRKH